MKNKVIVKIRGVDYVGYYEIIGSIRDNKSIISVSYKNKNKAAHLGEYTTSPEKLASLLLRELINI